MASRARKLLLAGIALSAFIVQSVAAKGGPDAPLVAAGSAYDGPAAQTFTMSEVRHFLEKAKQAEIIKDSLERCLSYPDPPGSHWSQAATRAYCVYSFQTMKRYEEVRSLIQSGHVAELDQYFADALEKQLTQPGSAGLLDHIYDTVFKAANASQTRATTESWKEQSPKSAFAYAASGRSYLAMAWMARGEASVGNTPSENFRAMHRWLALAVADLDKAIALNPRVMPAYSTMIRVAMLNGDDSYAAEAMRMGLAIEPANYSIYEQLVWMSEPKWGGSLQEMRSIVSAAQMHAKDNALLELLLPLPGLYDANLGECNCEGSPDPGAYRIVLDKVTGSDYLQGAAEEARVTGFANLAVVYQSEVLRFNPANEYGRLRRADNLAAYDEGSWAREEAGKSSPDSIQLGTTAKAYGDAYRSLGEAKLAEKGYLRAIAINASDKEARFALGMLYVYSTHQWEKGWALANQLIQDVPNDPKGWLLRARIQRDQPRPGLQDTVSYFIAHFAADPRKQGQVEEMKMLLVPKGQEAAYKPQSAH